MTNTIRSVRSTLSFFLAVLELVISITLAVKVFQSDVASENGLVGYISEFLGAININVTGLGASSETTGIISSLILILVFMIFSQALFLAVPGIIERGQKNSARINGRRTFTYAKKRFSKNRFFKKQNRYQEDYFF